MTAERCVGLIDYGPAEHNCRSSVAHVVAGNLSAYSPACSMPLPDQIAFGDFLLERSQQRVTHRDGKVLLLTPRLVSALQLFVDHAGELLDKDTLLAALWPGLVVEENNLSQVISGLRRALGDDAQGSRYIQTVPRRGFRFVATVTPLLETDPTWVQPRDVPPVAPSHTPGPPAPEASAVDVQAASRPGLRASDLPGRRRWLLAGLAAASAALLGGAGWWASRRAGADGLTPPVATLAVLPFKPLLPEGRDALLEVGMADSLIARLSTVPGLAVRSIGSVLRYAGQDQDPLRAARELEVSWIVDGSLQRRGDQLRASARLLRASDGVAAWSGSFDAKFTGVFEMQDLISTRVMQALAATLQAGFGTQAPLSHVGGTLSLEAYQIYMAASRHSESMRADGLQKSVALFNQALAVDPGYALAWVGLAHTHRRHLFGVDALPAEVFEPAKLAVQRALALAPDLAQAHAELGFRLYWFDFEWRAAEAAFRRALTLNANVAAAHHGLAVLLLTQDRQDEGFAHLRLARQLDPMSPVYNTAEATYLLDSGALAQSRARLERTFDIAPNFWLAHLTLGVLLLAEQQPGPGIEALRRAVALADGSTRGLSLLAMHLARLGQRDEARAILSRLQAVSMTRHVPPTSLATVHAALGEVAPALAALEQAYVARDTRLIYLKDDPRWTGLRKEPRFVALMQKLGLDRYGPGLSVN